MSDDWSAHIVRARKALQTAENAANLKDYQTALQAAHAVQDHAANLADSIVQAQVELTTLTERRLSGL